MTNLIDLSLNPHYQHLNNIVLYKSAKTTKHLISFSLVQDWIICIAWILMPIVLKGPKWIWQNETGLEISFSNQFSWDPFTVPIMCLPFSCTIFAVGIQSHIVHWIYSMSFIVILTKSNLKCKKTFPYGFRPFSLFKRRG